MRLKAQSGGKREIKLMNPDGVFRGYSDGDEGCYKRAGNTRKIVEASLFERVDGLLAKCVAVGEKESVFVTDLPRLP